MHSLFARKKNYIVTFKALAAWPGILIWRMGDNERDKRSVEEIVDSQWRCPAFHFVLRSELQMKDSGDASNKMFLAGS